MTELWIGGAPNDLPSVRGSLSGARFTLLDLDPGEIYFQDFGATLCCKRRSVKLSPFKGRLKICSKSFLFEPANLNQPIIKFPLRSLVAVEEFRVLGLANDAWEGVRPGATVRLLTTTTVEIKENNVVAPFRFRKHDDGEEFVVAFHYVNCATTLPLMTALFEASKSSFSRQAEIVDEIQRKQAEVKFNRNWLDNAFETILLQLKAERISPLIANPGHVVITASKLYFQPFNNIEPFPCLKLKLGDITHVFKRRYLLRHVGLEITCRAATLGGVSASFDSSLHADHLTHAYFVCENQEARDQLYDVIAAQNSVSLVSDRQMAITLQWQNGLLSNFDYLMELNCLANRSMSDLTQYPVFPWVLSDYVSETLDLNDPAVYRDLSKPVGALNEERLGRLLSRFKEMPEPRFLYGSHYSTPGFVLFYLVRSSPEYMLCLQNGRFDLPDRMFNSVAEAWKNVLSNNSDFKELIPEFFMPATDLSAEPSGVPSFIGAAGLGGKFLTNYRQIDFGTRQATGKSVQDVELPPWARTYAHFVETMRNALENDHVSNNLHEWIDLIFGYKQRGEAAIKAHNVFHHLTYEGSVDVDAAEPGERAALEAQILEFGQTPTQLFPSPHPRRRPAVDSVIAETKALRGGSIGSRDDVYAHPPALGDVLFTTSDKRVHREAVTAARFVDYGARVVTCSKDGFIKVYCLEKERQLVSFSISTMPLTCLDMLPDNEAALLGSSDNNVYLFHLSQCVSSQPMDYAHDDSVTHLCWANDILLTCSSDCSAKLWSFPYKGGSGNHPEVDLIAILDHENAVMSGAVTQDAKIVATGTESGGVFLWNETDWSSPLTVIDEFHTSPVFGLAFDPLSPNHIKLASCSVDGVVAVLDVSSGTRIFSARDAELACMRWMQASSSSSSFPSLDGLYCGKANGDLDVWDMIIGAKSATLFSDVASAAMCVDVHRDAGIVVGRQNGAITWWRWKGGIDRG